VWQSRIEDKNPPHKRTMSDEAISTRPRGSSNKETNQSQVINKIAQWQQKINTSATEPQSVPVPLVNFNTKQNQKNENQPKINTSATEPQSDSENETKQNSSNNEKTPSLKTKDRISMWQQKVEIISPNNNSVSPTQKPQVPKKVLGGGIRCPICNKLVYAAERTDFEGKAYHPACYRKEISTRPTGPWQSQNLDKHAITSSLMEQYEKHKMKITEEITRKEKCLLSLILNI